MKSLHVGIILFIFLYVTLAEATIEVEDSSWQDDLARESNTNTEPSEDEFQKVFHLPPFDDPPPPRAKALKQHQQEVLENNKTYQAGDQTRLEGINEFSDIPMEEILSNYTGLIESEQEVESDRFYDRYSRSRGCTCRCKCSHGWTNYGNFCYKVHPDKVSWAEARTLCHVQDNADLASIHSEGERAFAWGLTGRNEHTWIGGNDLHTEGMWTWTDGTTWVNSLWARGQPDNWQGNQDCALLWKDDNGRFDDATCNWKFKFICKKAGNQPYYYESLC